MKKYLASKFNINFKKIGGDPKFIIGAIIAVGGIITGILTYCNLPGRVEALEKDMPECQTAVQDLANTVNSYIQKQAIKEEAQEKIEENRVKHQVEMNALLIEWIRGTKEANGG